MIKISVVEDQIDIRKGLMRSFSREIDMVCVSSYASAEEALSKIVIDDPDIILMDIGLPKMNGIECMIRLKLKNPEMEFLMFTVFEDNDQVFEALKAGAAGYILKEEGAHGVIKAIRELKRGGAPMSRNIAKKVLTSFSQNQKSINSSFENLTNQQQLVLELLAEGLLNKEIGDRMGISERTVKQHNNAIYKKLQVNNRTEAARVFMKRQE